jgi:hypothetical protein
LSPQLKKQKKISCPSGLLPRRIRKLVFFPYNQAAAYVAIKQEDTLPAMYIILRDVRL